jgi:hypothetical protein
MLLAQSSMTSHTPSGGSLDCFRCMDLDNDYPSISSTSESNSDFCGTAEMENWENTVPKTLSSLPGKRRRKGLDDTRTQRPRRLSGSCFELEQPELFSLDDKWIVKGVGGLLPSRSTCQNASIRRRDSKAARTWDVTDFMQYLGKDNAVRNGSKSPVIPGPAASAATRDQEISLPSSSGYPGTREAETKPCMSSAPAEATSSTCFSSGSGTGGENEHGTFIISGQQPQQRQTYRQSRCDINHINRASYT